MKYSKSHFLTLTLSLVFCVGLFAQNVAITDDETHSADNSAMLDVKSDDKGMLVPRIDFNDKPASPATGLLVYVTANGPEGNNAFYYYNGTDWVKIINESAETDPVYGSSVAAGITGTDTTGWNNKLESETQSLADVAAIDNSVNAQLKNVSDPIDAQDAATKAYIDEMLINAGKLTVKDYDGNVYNTVTIGDQLWMAENLRTTHYADGTALVDGTSAGNISEDYTTKYYFWYNNDSTTNAATDGALYTWAAVMNGSSSSSANPSGILGVCPDGWHLPSDAEWTELTNYLTNNGYGYEGSGSDIGKAMASTSGWITSSTTGAVGNDQASNNNSGFMAIAGGKRLYNGTFSGSDQDAYFWSATEESSNNAQYLRIHYNDSVVYWSFINKSDGFSVRCVKD